MEICRKILAMCQIKIAYDSLENSKSFHLQRSFQLDYVYMQQKEYFLMVGLLRIRDMCVDKRKGKKIFRINLVDFKLENF